MNDKVKVRLRRRHYHNAQLKRAGSVITLDSISAKWLIEKRVAEPVVQPKPPRERAK